MERNPFVDVLKGIFIIFVIILHFPFETREQLQYLFPFWITLTVPFFMMISGYVSALSLKKRGIERPEEAYSPGMMAEKILRYTIPFTIAFGAEWILFRAFGVYRVGIKTYGLFAFVQDYLTGGKGPGSYYFPMMIQFVFLFPVIYFVIRRYRFRGLLGCLGANAVFELLKTAYGMSDTEYRLLVLRFLFVIGAGCYVALKQGKQSRAEKFTAVAALVAGAGFIYLFSYTSYAPKVLTYWAHVSFAPCLAVVPVLGFILAKGRMGCKPIELIGRASFHIYLVQMIYYNFAERIYALIPGKGMQLLCNILLCVTVGVLFYLAERPLNRAICSRVRRICAIKKNETIAP